MSLRGVVGTQDDPDQLHVSARLFAETDAGERLSVTRSSMGAGLWRRGVLAIWKRYSGPPLIGHPLQCWNLNRRRERASYRQPHASEGHW
jgi:hypothetical protein